MDKVRCAEALKSSQLFYDLSPDQISKVVDICSEEFYEAGVRIFSEGDSAHRFYVVEEGKVAIEMEVRIGSRTRKQATLEVITRGQIVGWSALSDRLRFTMSAVATENTELIACEGKLLFEIFEEDHDLYQKVIRALSNVVTNRVDNAKRTLAHVLAVTSHDLRAPLATVQSCLDVIIGGFAGDINDKQKELLSGSKQRIADLTNMIDNILDISYIEISEKDFETISLYSIVESSIGDVQGMAAQKQIQVVNNMAEDLSPVLGLPKRLRQVFTNLLSNAVKFTPVKGMVTVNSSFTKDSIQLEFCDTGVGISKEELPRIFDDFYRGMKVDAEGAGLGLAIAKKIVEAHGGHIYVESPCPKTGTGTKFVLSIPDVAIVSKKEGEDEKVAIAGAKILVADDDPQMRKVTSIILESQGYQVSTAQDGQEALVRIEEEKPDLIILDLLMPVMDGFEVCKQLKENDSTSRIPVLIFSAVREESSRRRYELETKVVLDIDDYIEKPISPPVLLQRVEKVLRRSKSGLL